MVNELGVGGTGTMSTFKYHGRGLCCEPALGWTFTHTEAEKSIIDYGLLIYFVHSSKSLKSQKSFVVENGGALFSSI